MGPWPRQRRKPKVWSQNWRSTFQVKASANIRRDSWEAENFSSIFNRLIGLREQKLDIGTCWDVVMATLWLWALGWDLEMVYPQRRGVSEVDWPPQRWEQLCSWPEVPQLRHQSWIVTQAICKIFIYNVWHLKIMRHMCTPRRWDWNAGETTGNRNSSVRDPVNGTNRNRL